MLLAGAMLAAIVSAAPPPPAGAWAEELEAWHAGRIERLQAPAGWLSLVGLPWLAPGANSVGSGADNQIVLPAGPEHLGVITWHDDGRVTLALDVGADARIEGVTGRATELLDDSHAEPTRVRFGTTSFYLISRSDRKGLRVKDSEAPTRLGFSGIERFAPDPSWRVVADWVPFEPARELEVATVIGTVERYPVPGKLVFSRDGQRFELLPVLPEPDARQLFLEFSDRTSGSETYGAGRMLYIDLPREGKAVVDFNRAYNPPCVFTPYATCDLAPPENRLDLQVTAGEKKYAGPRAIAGDAARSVEEGEDA